MGFEPNPEQRAAIDVRGRVFVSAGAGTGKTAVLVERFARAVCDDGVDVESILVITYTRKAAGELRARIRGALAERGRHDLARRLDGAWISTIHGFCNRLLKAHPFEAGLDPRFRELDETEAAVLRSEAFDEALAEFCSGDDPGRLRLLVSYGGARLRGMLIGVYETLRAAGRDLVLELGEAPPLAERIEELRVAARCLAEDAAATDAQRGNADALLALLEGGPSAERLLDLSAFRARGERAASYEEARRRVEQAALDQVAAGDRDLLQELLDRFHACYSAAKERESALDFEDLQLVARDLLRDHPQIREREQLRFRSIMVDEFQDTNRLQCELIDLLEGRELATRSWGAAGKGGEPEARRTVQASTAEGRGRSTLRVWPGRRDADVAPADVPPATPASSLEPHLPPAASGGGECLRVQNRPERAGPLRAVCPAGAHAVQGRVGEVFVVGDEVQSIYGFRHADVQVFRERRVQSGGGLALTQNYRSRPEVLAAVNELFRSDFGGEFQPLTASGEFPDPVFGHPVELLVTEKSSYADSGVHWRRGEARHIARRVKELVESGAAAPGEIVLLFAAGTDAEWYEEELRRAGLPTYRATGRGYFGQQQVVDLLAYLRLLHNRYDDQALVTVLASPFVGVSNDALVLIRRAAGKRPLFSGIERALPAALGRDDEQLLRAFKQRYERLVAASGRLSLERLCERIVAEHDYDLAMLAQWDGRRRYANLRKLARLARSYEELRGPDIEGFVRFARQQEAVGARELEAVAEEEGADAVRLLTIHAAKGLEFKVVIVADAGRDKPPPSPDEILALSDGRFGFRVADPVTSKRRGAFAYDEVREAREAEERAERLRLYYVAMTRAIDRLIVSGAIDAGKRADESTPMGWVLARLDCAEDLERAAEEPIELERGAARLLLRVDRRRPEAEVEPEEAAPAPEVGQLQLFEPLVDGGARLGPVLPALEPIPPPPLHEVRRLSYSALALFERCSYRYFAERVAGMRERRAVGTIPGQQGLGATEVGDAVHRLLEQIDLAAPAVPNPEQVRSWYPAVTDEELERIRSLVASYCESELAGRVASLEGAQAERPFAFEQDGVLLHGRLDVLQLTGGRALVVDFKTNALDELSPAEIVDAEYRLQRLVYAIACFRAGADEVEVVYQFLERPGELVATTFRRVDLSALEEELSAAIARIRRGEFVPTPSDFACAGCPALDVICAGPRLPSTPRAAVAAPA